MEPKLATSCDCEGITEGDFEGDLKGIEDGSLEGDCDCKGIPEGSLEGEALREELGMTDGLAESEELGEELGLADGHGEGVPRGNNLVLCTTFCHRNSSCSFSIVLWFIVGVPSLSLQFLHCFVLSCCWCICSVLRLACHEWLPFGFDYPG